MSAVSAVITVQTAGQVYEARRENVPPTLVIIAAVCRVRAGCRSWEEVHSLTAIKTVQSISEIIKTVLSVTCSVRTFLRPAAALLVKIID